MGIVMMTIAILISLALVTYSAGDDRVARSFSIETAIDPGDNEAHNALGLVGASIARTLIPNFIGYNVLVFTLLLFIWGYAVFRGRQYVHLPLISFLGTLVSFNSACVFGWIGLVFDTNTYLWSGAVGSGLAGWMTRLFGTYGTIIILSILLIVIALLLVDHDIQRSLDRVEDLFRGIHNKIRSWWSDYRVRVSNSREERKEKLSQDRVARQDRSSPSELRTDPGVLPGHQRQTSHNQIKRVHESSGLSLNDLFREARSEGVAPAPPKTPAVDNPQREEGSPQLELKIRQRIEEEKAENINRSAGKNIDDDIPYTFPQVDLLDEADTNTLRIDYKELEENKRVLLEKLATYNIEITDINAIVGPTVTLYELTPAPGVKISRITALEDDLAMAMAARGIRMIAPIPGKSAIGVEIPNRHRELVRIRDIIGTAKFRDARMELPVSIGKTIEGEVFLEDLTRMPHLLIAGATGSGKSVGLNALITGLLYACHPSNLKLVMIDPKKIELQQYASIVDHYIAMPPDADEPIITDFMQALGVLKCCEKEMERRYDLLSKATVRGIKDYNQRFKQGRLDTTEGHRHLPYIVVIVDELADLMMTAGKDIEGPIARLAQMARAVGIHLVLATQRPSVDVITGLIKANFPSRIAYQVASKVDSRTILDQNGAEGLVGNGDLLYMHGSRIIRLQGPYVSVDEVEEITQFICKQPGSGPYILPSLEESVSDPLEDGDVPEDTDDLFKEAARIIVRSQQGSVSLLQRKLSVGYARAARIVDQLEEAGIVGPFEGSKARQVLVENEIQLDELFRARGI